MDFLSILRSNGPQKTSDRTGGCCWYGLQTLTCMIWLVLNTECKISNIPFEILWSFKLQTEDSRDEKTNKIKLQSFLFHSVPRQFHLGIITKFHPSNKQVRVLQRLNHFTEFWDALFSKTSWKFYDLRSILIKSLILIINISSLVTTTERRYNI